MSLHRDEQLPESAVGNRLLGRRGRGRRRRRSDDLRGGKSPSEPRSWRSSRSPSYGDPLLPYVLSLATAFPISVEISGLAFVTVDASQSLVTRRSWIVDGVEMLVVGMPAATVAYVVGTTLRGLA